MARIVLVCLFLAGCAPPVVWMKADGGVATEQQRQLAMTVCTGDVEKAAVQGQAHSTVASPFGMDRQDARVYAGCMAQQGYVSVPLR